MNEFFVLSIDCSENDDCEGLVTTCEGLVKGIGNNPQPQTLAVSHVLDVRLMYLYFCFEAEPSDNFQNTAVEMHVSDEKC